LYDAMFRENRFVPDGRGAEQRQLAVVNAGAWSGGVGILKDATLQCEDAQSRRQRDSKVAAVERGAGTRMDARPRRRPRPNWGGGVVTQLLQSRAGCLEASGSG
jgi:hypothetical protein